MTIATEEPVPARRWYILIILTLIFAVGCIDRFAFNILLEPMRRDLGATDAQMGLLGGAAFIVTYCAFGIPMARLADRGSRHTVLAASLGVWSLMTLLSGMVGSVAQAAIARIGLGAAEAGGSPASLSMISDLFRDRRRPLAVSIYQSGMAIAALIGAPITGVLAQFYGWRAAFYIFGVTGFVLLLVLLVSVPEPRRETVRDDATSAPFGTVLRSLFIDRNFRLLLASQLCVGIPTGILPIWFPVLLMRAEGLPIAMASLVVALLFGVVMLAGFFSNGLLVTRMMQRRGLAASALVPAIACAIAAPLGVLMLSGQSLEMTLVFAVPFFFFLFLSRPSGAALALDLAGSDRRGVASMLVILATSIVGGGFGPAAIGLATDLMAPAYGRGEALRFALLGATPIAILLSGICFILLFRRLAAAPAPAQPFGQHS